MLTKYGIVFLAVISMCSYAQAQEVDPTIQKSAIISALAQQLSRVETMSQTYQTQLAEAHKQIGELKAKCGEPCKDAAQK